MINIIQVINKYLPESDYRLALQKQSKKCNLILSMPDNKINDFEKSNLRIDFREGIGIRDLANFYNLFIVLSNNRKKIDIVHFSSSTKLILIGPIISGLLRIKSLITITGMGRAFDNNGIVYYILRIIYFLAMKFVLHLTERVLFQNYGQMEIFKKYYPRYAYKYEYIGSAVSVPIAEHREYIGEYLNIILVARIIKAKGIMDFIEVAKETRKRNKKINFVLIGPKSNGSIKEYKQVLQEHVSKNIVYLGELHGEELVNKYLESHVIFFPSKGEGMARVLLEAGFCGLCPIAYDLPANKDIIKKNGGFIVPNNDINSVVSLILKLENDRELIKKNAKTFQYYIVNNYSIENYISRIEKIVEEIAT